MSWRMEPPCGGVGVASSIKGYGLAHSPSDSQLRHLYLSTGYEPSLTLGTARFKVYTRHLISRSKCLTINSLFPSLLPRIIRHGLFKLSTVFLFKVSEMLFLGMKWRPRRTIQNILPPACGLPNPTDSPPSIKPPSRKTYKIKVASRVRTQDRKSVV